jgi:hypothetical protein
MSDLDSFVNLLEKEVFNGTLPPFPNEIVAAVLVCVPYVRNLTEAEQQDLANALYLALCRRIEPQDFRQIGLPN